MRPSALCFALALGACTTHIEPPGGLGSFKVAVLDLDDFSRGGDCITAPKIGTAACPRPFPEVDAPVTVHLHITAVDRDGHWMQDFAGNALVDVRPGRLANVGPGGLYATFTGGVADVEVQLILTYGPTRVWIEQCTAGGEEGTYATGVSEPIIFDKPRLDQLNVTTNNRKSPMEPHATNTCAISGDPRYGIGFDEEGEAAFVGYSHGRSVDAPPPAIGTYVEVVGCSRAEYVAAKAAGGGCNKGPLVVTGIGNEGFYVTDLNDVAQARGFNHLYAFNFNYPDDLEVGDVVLSLRGTPVDFAGSTQIGNPSWTKDDGPKEPSLLPAPVKIDPAVYANMLTRETCSLRSFGGNRETQLDLEKLEGALVCVDHIVLPAYFSNCDYNASGSIERDRCRLSCDEPLPPLCDEGVGVAPRPRACDEASMQPTCIPLTAEERDACYLPGFWPGNVQEYCCERICYQDFDCTEGSSFEGFGQWTGDITGTWSSADAGPVRMGFITRDADPDFKPTEEGAKLRKLPVAERKTVRIIGNLRHVLAARPVWVVVARSPADIDKSGAECP